MVDYKIKLISIKMEQLDIVVQSHALDELLYTTEDLKIIDMLLDIKQSKNQEWVANEKSHSSDMAFMKKVIDMYSSEIHILCNIIQKYLVISRYKTHVCHTASFIIDQAQDFNIQDYLKVLNTVLLTVNELGEIASLEENLNISIQEMLLNALNTTRDSSKFVLSDIVPNFLRYSANAASKKELLNGIFMQCKKDNELFKLSQIFEYIPEEILLNTDVFIYEESYWRFLKSCILNANTFLRKEAMYILQRSVEFIIKHAINLELINTCNDSHPEQVWKDYFLLLEIANEKYSHLIKPSLHLLESLDFLHFIWQLCAYKILLECSQSNIVYTVVKHLLYRKKMYSRDMLQLILPAINRNEHSDQSKEAFCAITEMCKKLDEQEATLLFEEVLSISWNPCSLWNLIKSIFDEKHIIPFGPYFQNLIVMCKKLPHKYIRNGCCAVIERASIKSLNAKYKDYICCNLCVLSLSNETLTVENCSECLLYQSNKNEYPVSLEQVQCLYNFCKCTSSSFNYSELCIGIRKILSKFLAHKITGTKCCWQKLKSSCRILYLLGEHEDITILLRKIIIQENVDLKLAAWCEIYHLNANINNDEICNKTNLEELLLQILHNDSCVIENYENLGYLMKQVLVHKECQSFFNTMINKSRISDHQVYMTLQYYIGYQIDLKHLESVFGNLKKIMSKGKFKPETSKMFIYLQLKCLKAGILPVEYIFELVDMYGDMAVLSFFDDPAFQETDLFFDVLKTLYKHLPNLVHSKYFQKIVRYFTQCIFSKKILNQEDIEFINNYLYPLIPSHPYLRNILLENIYCYLHSTLSMQDAKMDMNFVIALVLKLYIYHGMCIKKEERTEFEICNEIYTTTSLFDENIYFNNSVGNTKALATLIVIVNRFPKFTTIIFTKLLEEYKRDFPKRYFPDSEAYFKRLRIFQILLTILSVVKHREDICYTRIAEEIMDGLKREPQQSDIRQMMQWILGITYLKNLEGPLKDKIHYLISSDNINNILVTYHLMLMSKDEKLWEDVANYLLPITMGPQFKLRIYAQFTIKLLITNARNRGFEQFLTRYSHLENAIDSTLADCGKAFYDTLKTDYVMFHCFDPLRDMSLETIYFDLPRLNRVHLSEWYYMSKIKLNEDLDWNSSKIFKKAVDDALDSGSKNSLNTVSAQPAGDFQIKITPWKQNALKECCGIDGFILIASLIDKPQNLGGLMRTCEVYGVKNITVHNAKVLSIKEFTGLSMSSENWVKVTEVKASDLREYLVNLRDNGYCLLGAEQTSSSNKLHFHKFQRKTALLLGNEKTGIPPYLIPLLDTCVEIPQLGMIRSLNVHVAGAIIIWEYAKQFLL